MGEKQTNGEQLITLMLSQLRERANTILYDADMLIKELETLRENLQRYNTTNKTE